MAEIRAIAANTNCDNIGGAAYAYATDIANIDLDNVTVDASGVITDFTMLTSGTWELLQFDDDDDVCFFNETSERITGGGLVYNGEGLMNFKGLTQDKITAANLAGLCCGVVIIWVHYSGLRRVEGLDVNPSTQAVARSKKLCKIQPIANSGTGAETETLQYGTTHQGRYLSATTSLTDAQIEAL